MHFLVAIYVSNTSQFMRRQYIFSKHLTAIWGLLTLIKEVRFPYCAGNLSNKIAQKYGADVIEVQHAALFLISDV